MRVVAIKYKADQSVVKAEKENNKKKYCATNKICTNRNVKDINDLDVRCARKKHRENLKVACSKPLTESVPSTSLEVTSTSISTTNQYPVRHSQYSLEEVHVQLLNQKKSKQGCIDSLLSVTVLKKESVTCVIIS